MNVNKSSHVIFALTFVALGIMGLVIGDFAPVWAGVPRALPDRQILAYVCSFVSLACGAGLLAKRTAAPAAFLLGIYLVVWTALFKVPFIIRHPLVEVSYQSVGENVVLIAGAWILFVSAAESEDEALRKLAQPARERTAYVLYGLALIAFGFSHFIYLNLTAPLVPAWLPRPVFWAYFTGGVYLASGLLVVTGFATRLGAVISAVQIALITILVWGPFVLTGQLGARTWQEPVVSWALTAAAWVVADSFRGRPWLHRIHRGPMREEAAVEAAL